MTLLLVTAANGPYLPRITPYLYSIQANAAGFDRRVLVTVGCRVEMPAELGAIDAVPLPATEALGHTGNWCVQQGCFLNVLGANDDDVVCFTDGDVRMQRPPVPSELAWMRAIPHGVFSAGWNAGPGDTLLAEAGRLSLNDAGRAAFADVLHRPVYNVGVFVARVATYRAMYAEYLRAWPNLGPNTPHYAANQFGMCAAAWRLGLAVWETPPTVHTHDHCGIPPYAVGDEAHDTLYAHGVPVLFRHHWRV